MLKVIGIILLQLSERHAVKKTQNKTKPTNNTTKTPGQTLESLELEQFPLLLF